MRLSQDSKQSRTGANVTTRTTCPLEVGPHERETTLLTHLFALREGSAYTHYIWHSTPNKYYCMQASDKP